jgi:hypothetical protein
VVVAVVSIDFLHQIDPSSFFAATITSLVPLGHLSPSPSTLSLSPKRAAPVHQPLASFVFAHLLPPLV